MEHHEELHWQRAVKDTHARKPRIFMCLHSCSHSIDNAGNVLFTVLIHLADTLHGVHVF